MRGMHSFSECVPLPYLVLLITISTDTNGNDKTKI